MGKTHKATKMESMMIKMMQQQVVVKIHKKQTRQQWYGVHTHVILHSCMREPSPPLSYCFPKHPSRLNIRLLHIIDYNVLLLYTNQNGVFEDITQTTCLFPVSFILLMYTMHFQKSTTKNQINCILYALLPMLLPK